MAKKHEETPTGLYLVAIVGIVAVFGLVVLVMGNGGSNSVEDVAYDDLTGQVWVKSAGVWNPGGYTPTAAYNPYRPRVAEYNPLNTGIVDPNFQEGPNEEGPEEDPCENPQGCDNCYCLGYVNCAAQGEDQWSCS